MLTVVKWRKGTAVVCNTMSSRTLPQVFKVRDSSQSSCCLKLDTVSVVDQSSNEQREGSSLQEW